MAPIADAVAGSEFASSITVELIGMAGKEAIAKVLSLSPGLSQSFLLTFVRLGRGLVIG